MSVLIMMKEVLWRTINDKLTLGTWGANGIFMSINPDIQQLTIFGSVIATITVIAVNAIKIRKEWFEMKVKEELYIREKQETAHQDLLNIKELESIQKQDNEQ